MNGGMMFNNDGAMQLPPGVGEIIPGVLYVGPHTACERMVSDFGVRYVVECLSEEERRTLHEQRYHPLTKNLQYSKQIIAALSEAVECCLETGTHPSCTNTRQTATSKKNGSNTIEQQLPDGLQVDDVAALKNARASLLREFGDKNKTNSNAWDQLGDADAKTTEAPEDVELMWTRTKQEYLNLILEKALSASSTKRDAGTAVTPHTAKLIESVEKYQRLLAEAVKEETGDADDDDDKDGEQHADPTSATSFSPSKAPEGLVDDPTPPTVPAEPIDANNAAPQLSAEDQEALWRGYKLVYPPKVRLVTVPMEDSLTEDITMALNAQKPIQPFQRFGIGSEKVPADGVAPDTAAFPSHVYRHRWSVDVGADGKQRLMPAGPNKPSVATTEEDLIDELDGHTKAHAVTRDAQHRLGLEHVGVPLVTRPEGLPTPLPIVTFLDEILCQNPSVSYLEELSTVAMTKMLAKQRKEQDATLGYQPSKVSELNDNGIENDDDASPVIPVYERHAVFIHCYAGKSRGPAITAAYLLLSQYLAARTSDAGGAPDIFVPVSENNNGKEEENKKSHVTAFNRRGPYYSNPPLHNLEEAMELLCHCGPLTVTRGFNVPSVPDPSTTKDDDDDAEGETPTTEVDPNSVAEIVLEDSAVQAIHSICTATHKQYETLVALQQQLLEAKIQHASDTTDTPATKKNNDTGLNDDTNPAPLDGENDEDAEQPLTKEEEFIEMQANVEKGSRQVKVLSEFLAQIKDAHAFNRKALTNLRKDYESAYIDRHLTPSSERAANSEGSTMDGLGAAGSKISFGRVVAKGRGVRPNPKFIQDLIGLENAVMQAHNRVVEFNEFVTALKGGQTFNAKQLKAIAAAALEGDEPYPTAFDQDDYNLEGLLDLFVRGESGNMITTLTEPEVYKIFMSPEVDRDVVKARRVCTKEHAKKLFSTTSRRRQMAETICTLLNEDEELRVANEKKAAKEAALAAGLKNQGANKNIFAGKGIQIMLTPESVIAILAECKDDMEVALMHAMAEKKKQLEKAIAAEMNSTH